MSLSYTLVVHVRILHYVHVSYSFYTVKDEMRFYFKVGIYLCVHRAIAVCPALQKLYPYIFTLLHIKSQFLHALSLHSNTQYMCTMEYVLLDCSIIIIVMLMKFVLHVFGTTAQDAVQNTYLC